MARDRAGLRLRPAARRPRATLLPATAGGANLRYRISLLGPPEVQTVDTIGGELDEASLPAFLAQGTPRLLPTDLLSAEGPAARLEPVADLGGGLVAVLAEHLGREIAGAGFACTDGTVDLSLRARLVLHEERKTYPFRRALPGYEAYDFDAVTLPLVRDRILALGSAQPKGDRRLPAGLRLDSRLPAGAAAKAVFHVGNEIPEGVVPTGGGGCSLAKGPASIQTSEPVRLRVNGEPSAVQPGVEGTLHDVVRFHRFPTRSAGVSRPAWGFRCVPAGGLSRVGAGGFDMRHIWIGIVALTLVGCGGGGGGGGAPGSLTPPTFDATGTWVAVATGSFTSPAGDEEQDSAAEVVVTQTGNDVSVQVVGDTVVYTGTVSGAVYQVAATLPEPDGSTAETIDFTLTSADAGSGTLTWVFTGTGGAMSGGSNLALARSIPASFDMTGTWTLTTTGNFSVPPGNEDSDGSISAPFTQTGNAVQATLDGGVRTGFVSGSDYFIEWDVDEGGGAETTVFVTFTLSSATAGAGALQWRYENGSIIDGGANLGLSKP